MSQHIVNRCENVRFTRHISAFSISVKITMPLPFQLISVIIWIVDMEQKNCSYYLLHYLIHKIFLKWNKSALVGNHSWLAHHELDVIVLYISSVFAKRWIRVWEGPNFPVLKVLKEKKFCFVFFFLVLFFLIDNQNVVMGFGYSKSDFTC